jgi:hypothetical protein
MVICRCCFGPGAFFDLLSLRQLTPHAACCAVHSMLDLPKWPPLCLVQVGYALLCLTTSGLLPWELVTEQLLQMLWEADPSCAGERQLLANFIPCHHLLLLLLPLLLPLPVLAPIITVTSFQCRSGCLCNHHCCHNSFDTHSNACNGDQAKAS